MYTEYKPEKMQQSAKLKSVQTTATQVSHTKSPNHFYQFPVQPSRDAVCPYRHMHVCVFGGCGGVDASPLKGVSK